MKKVFCLLLVIITVSAVGLVTFVGCSNTPQTSKLQACWDNYEKSVYTAYHNGNEIGELTITLRKYQTATDIAIGNGSYSVTGTVLDYALSINCGEGSGDTLTKKVAINSGFSPIASYVERSFGGITSTRYITYDSAKKSTLYVDGGEGKTFSHSKTTFYDNDMSYFILRATGIFEGDSYSVSFSVADNDNGGVFSVTGGGSSDIKVNTGLGSFDGKKFYLTASTDLGSDTNYVSFAKAIPLGENKIISKPIIKIEEGDYSYILKSISVVEE